ncbi:unnamed protein product [Effrenium voratum]|nr:unnamed protein product [Effrenium voratum]
MEAHARSIYVDIFHLQLMPVREDILDDLKGNNRAGGGMPTYLYKSAKIRKALDEVEDGEVFLFTDVDVQYFQPVKGIVEERMASGVDMIFQKEFEDIGVNIGWMALRNTGPCRAFWDHVYGEISRTQALDQRVVNNSLYSGATRPRWACAGTAGPAASGPRPWLSRGPCRSWWCTTPTSWWRRRPPQTPRPSCHSSASFGTCKRRRRRRRPRPLPRAAMATGRRSWQQQEAARRCWTTGVGTSDRGARAPSGRCCRKAMWRGPGASASVRPRRLRRLCRRSRRRALRVDA